MDRFDDIKAQYRRFHGDHENYYGWVSDVGWLIEHVEELRMQVGALANKFAALYGDNLTLEELMRITPYEKIVHLKALCKRQREQIEGLKQTISNIMGRGSKNAGNKHRITIRCDEVDYYYIISRTTPEQRAKILSQKILDDIIRDEQPEQYYCKSALPTNINKL